MDEIFVIERMLVVGVWELFSETFYTDEKKALDDCLGIMKMMQEKDKKFVARVTKLKINKK